ncbi:MAG: 50S ribosomal protein L16, partial [Phycisphaeraceae bacterium]
MPLMPKRVKFRKQQRGSLKGNATRGNYVAFGEYGLQVTEGGWLTARQIEAGRIAARQFVSREGKLFVRVFPDKPISKKPLETRMGKGKAEPEYWVARVKPGTVIYELTG